MEIIHTTYNAQYLPLPNRVEFVATRKMAPFELTKTSFVIPFIDNNQVIMAYNQRRGREIPGGHVDPGESLIEAAIRECLEETGYEINDIIPIGFLRMISDGEVPQGWNYPHPISYQQIFAGEISCKHKFIVNSECREPEIINVNNLDILSSEQKMLITAAQRSIYHNIG